MNTIRLRLWVNPSTNHSSLNEVKQFSETLKARGLKTWITVHFSDTWADPGQQIMPVAWQSLSITELHTT
ncbi:glycosyl hydrolase 53 family protein, partial [Bizionia echini]|uniref:glycosyl hydrolase 53 family protein n=1 Tax=Bizionia echini TaxID=649333 RepID=UPI0030DDB91A